MIKGALIISFVLTLILAACAPASLPLPLPSPTRGSTPLGSPLESPLSSSSLPEGTLLVYHRTGGFAGVNDTWTVAANGNVSYLGQRPIAPRPLDTAQMAELTAAVRAANFMSLEDSYVPVNDCCDRYMHEITVSLAGRTKTIRTVDSSPTEPAELTQLIQTLNQLLVTPPPAAQ